MTLTFGERLSVLEKNIRVVIRRVTLWWLISFNDSKRRSEIKMSRPGLHRKSYPDKREPIKVDSEHASEKAAFMFQF